MNLLDVVRRVPAPEPWSEGDNIPWNEPGFSARMLAEHLSQAHDAASRRAEVIDRHVSWIHEALMEGRQGSILDLGCGPGLYTARLAGLEHSCLGIDFSPASIAYARDAATEARLTCRYELGDIRDADYGTGYDLIMLIYGELNVFRPEDARRILRKARTALKPTGTLLLEVHSEAAVRTLGMQPQSWRTVESGLFSSQPHLLLEESTWDEVRQAATTRYFVIDAEAVTVARYAQSFQLYSDAGYHSLLAKAGWDIQQLGGALSGAIDGGAFVALIATPAGDG